ncbi:MAG TPA: ABC transporter permease [Gemmatimonadaceae bacterium]|jgi:simple sugar transport system permease protein|nr:ABC transporter permease [Gemmatimonadaceae bacterium]
MLEARWRTAGLRVPRAAIASAVLVVGAGGLVALAAALGGHDPARALAALWRGSLGSQYAVFSATLVRATPLILTGLAVALAFTAGVMNIGAEGQLLVGGAAATAIGLAFGESLGWLVIPCALGGGAVAGAAWAGVPGWLRRRFGVLEVISTIMMNFVALYLVGYLVRGPLQEPLRIYPQSAPIPDAAMLPLLGRTRLHVGFALALLCAVGTWWALRATAAGFRVRVVGASPEAAHSAGLIDVRGTTFRAFLVSGGLAGLAGAVEVTGVTYSLYENLSPGYGYTAIAVALVGQLNPLLTALSGIFFGALEAGAAAMQRDAGVPSVLATIVEASLILLVLAASVNRVGVFRRRSHGMAALRVTHPDMGDRR